MRSLKLVIWDLDETLVQGVFAEGDRDLAENADEVVRSLHERGVLQALATQNDPEVMSEAMRTYGWDGVFQDARADFAPKKVKVEAVLAHLDIAADHTVFVDDDPFERASIAVQIPGITTSSVAEMVAAAESVEIPDTEESRRRPEMYDELAQRRADGDAATDYEAFLASCDIQLSIRPYEAGDAERVTELLERTNRMNLGATMTPSETLDGLGTPDGPRIVIAELRDRYGDSGRCAAVRLSPTTTGAARIETLALSCRVRARGLALAMLVSLLRHPSARFDRFETRYNATGKNRPLRMLLWASGFEEDDDGLLVTTREKVDGVSLPEWLTVLVADEDPQPVTA
ncbi:MAG: hypothetical protein AAF389_11935 [Gemmatimonadota bacterium]